MSALLEKIQETVSYLKNIFGRTPEVGIVLGSGLGNFAKEIRVEAEVPYSEIPNFPVSTVEGHHGKLIFGTIDGKTIVAMSGRFHFYEGYSAGEVVFPIRVMKFLGISHLFISNAAGGVHPDFKVGDLMIINDHISFSTWNPLIGKNHNELGPRFPDMSEPYSKEIISTARKIGEKEGIKLHEGVYFGVTGPTFETHAEYRMIYKVGADAVGMSTVQEVITACHMGLKVFAISIITDLGIRDNSNAITHDEVLKAASEAEPKLSIIFRNLITSL